MAGTTSGTRNFDLSNGSVTIEAFDRIGMRPTDLSRLHFRSARTSLNLELQQWSNRGVNLWEVQPFTLQIVAGQAVYTAGTGVTNIPPGTQMMLDVYRSFINGAGPGMNIDTIMLPIGRDDYAEYPNKLQPGIPTTYWFEKLTSPTLTLWQPPEQGYPQWAVSGYLMNRIQDANLGGGEIPDVPYRAMDALCAGLAKRLAEKYKPARFALAKTQADDAWKEFTDQDQEDRPLSFQPQVQRYFR